MCTYMYIRTFILFYAFLLSALSLFLVAACLCLTESRVHFNGKINALIKKLEQALAPRFEGEMKMVGSYDGMCDDRDADHGELYWCPASMTGSSEDECCVYPAGNGDDGDYVCCNYDETGVVCANTEYSCTH